MSANKENTNDDETVAPAPVVNVYAEEYMRQYGVQGWEKAIKGGVFCKEEAEKFGILDHPEYVPKTVGYISPEHEFIAIDQDVKDGYSKVYRAHKIGPCKNCGKSFEDVLAMPLLGGPECGDNIFFCYSSRRVKSEAYKAKQSAKPAFYSKAAAGARRERTQ